MKSAGFHSLARRFLFFLFPSFSLSWRMSLSKCGRDTSFKACIFAISSAISPVQELLGVRHAASGSAATNPRGTIKLHLNNVSGRGRMRCGGWKKGKGRKARRRGEIRAAALRKKARSEWVVVRRLKRGDLAEEDVIALTTTAGERWAFRAIRFE